MGKNLNRHFTKLANKCMKNFQLLSANSDETILCIEFQFLHILSSTWYYCFLFYYYYKMKKKRQIGRILSASKNAEQLNFSCIAIENVKATQWKIAGKFLPKLHKHLSHGSAVPALNIYPSELKTDFYIKICIIMFIVALLIIAPAENNLHALQQ